MKHAKVVAAALLQWTSLMSMAACNRSVRHWQPYYSFGKDYLLYPALIERRAAYETEIVTFERQGINASMSDSGVVSTASAQSADFWLEVTNTNKTAICVLWPEARYIDEVGQAHLLFWRSASLPLDARKIEATTPTVLLPNQTLKATIQPVYKTYDVRYNRYESGEFSEPLVPTKFDHMTQQQVKAYIDDLARRQVPIKLLLPIEIRGVRFDYTFSFILKPPWLSSRSRSGGQEEWWARDRCTGRRPAPCAFDTPALVTIAPSNEQAFAGVPSFARIVPRIRGRAR